MAARQSKTLLTSQAFATDRMAHGIARLILKEGNWSIDEVVLGDHPDMKVRDRWINE